MSDLRKPGINDRWIRQQRGKKNQADPFTPYAFLTELERTPGGAIEEVNTIFLTNRECRFTCLMCDLWKNTTEGTVPEGVIPGQIEWALERLSPAKHIKLYNSANFFDPGVIPPADYQRIADLVKSCETVIVENHPNLTGELCLQFARKIKPQLQVAMGLETIHPGGLQQLNKKMLPGDFSRSVEFLGNNNIDARAFILLRPPFLSESEGVHWARESINYAFDAGAVCCTILPTRAGNGAMDQLQKQGHFTPPELGSLEEVQQYGISLGKGLIFADTWDLQQISTCEICFETRKRRMVQMNLEQVLLPPVRCTCSPGL